jgi:NAD(P)-dependent dehydrogenase (short-subunit alcohol dehydrogenase family)
MDLQLTKKIALVTGSTAGIGHAIAVALAREGATVIVNGRTSAAVDEAVAGMKAQFPCDVLGFAGDLSLASAAQDLLQRHPAVDILVNNLGIFEVKAFEEISDADWRRFFDVNVLSGARLARLYLPAMRRRNWGRIISGGNDSLRHDQVGADRRGPRLGGNHRRHGDHREQRAAGADALSRCGNFRRRDGGPVRPQRTGGGK